MKNHSGALSGLLLAAAFNPVLASGESPSEQLVARMAGPQSAIEKRFEAAPGIDGYIVMPPNGKPVLVYADRQGEFILSGVLFNKEGKNLSRFHHEQYMPKPDPFVILKEAETLSWVADGSADAPALLYVAAEPHCGHCKTFYSALRPFVDAGKIEVRWLLTGFSPSAQKAASSVLASNHPEDALKKTFAGAAINGGSDQDLKIKSNADFMLKHGIKGTPHLIYQDKSGAIQSRPGALVGDALTALVSEVLRKTN